MFKKRDPVCGAKVSKDTQHLLKYGNRIYYFDCLACKATFEKESNRFSRKRPRNFFLKSLFKETVEAPKSCHDVKM